MVLTSILPPRARRVATAAGFLRALSLRFQRASRNPFFRTRRLAAERFRLRSLLPSPRELVPPNLSARLAE